MTKTQILLNGKLYPQYIFEDYPTEFIEIGTYVNLRWNIEEKVERKKINSQPVTILSYHRETDEPYVVFERLRKFDSDKAYIDEGCTAKGGFDVDEIDQVIQELKLAKELINWIKEDK